MTAAELTTARGSAQVRVARRLVIQRTGLKTQSDYNSTIQGITYAVEVRFGASAHRRLRVRETAINLPTDS